MADGGNAKGFDVSHHQTVNWQEVAQQANMAFAFAKATDGITYIDPAFAANWAGMKAAGLIRGAYHYFEPKDDPASQVQNFLHAVQLAPGDLPPVLDVEVTGGLSSSQLWQGVAAWLQEIETETGRTPILYTYPSFWNENSPDLALTRYPLWLADYASRPTLPQGWTTWLFWQYSESGAVPGVTSSSGGVDLDEFNGTLEQLQAFAEGR